MKTEIPLVPVSWGEFTDKLTILELKKERIDNSESLKNINRELDYLLNIINDYGYLPAIVAEKDVLKETNLKLWNVLNEINDKTLKKEYDQEFIDLSVSVAVYNRQRHKTKKIIDKKLNSEISEEKRYHPYE
jgi:hypothetical protein